MTVRRRRLQVALVAALAVAIGIPGPPITGRAAAGGASPLGAARAFAGQEKDNGKDENRRKRGGNDKDGKDGKDEHDGKGDKPRELTEEEKKIERELKAVAEEFKAKEAAALVRRIAPKGSLRLKFGNKEAETLRPDPAKGRLTDWFKRREITSLKLKKQLKLVGTFELKFRNRAKDEVVEKVLTIELRKHAVDGEVKLVLAAILIHG